MGGLLPAERELAERLGIGRPAVREAIRVIEHRGLVTVRHGVGTTVTGVTARPVRETYRRALIDGKDRARHLLEARLAIEVETAALAAKRAQSRHRGARCSTGGLRCGGDLRGAGAA